MMRQIVRFAACCGLLVASGAQASIPTLYHPLSGTADPGALVPSYPAAARSLDLVLYPGSVANTSGTLCDTGNGDNVCGLYVEIAVDGDLGVNDESFAMASLPGAQMSDHADGQTVRIAIVTTASALPAAPILLGTLSVTSGTGGGAVHLRKLQTVDASLDLVSGTPRPLAFLPEPGFGSGIAASALALALLARLRVRRGGVR